MGNNEDHIKEQWRGVIARISTEIDDFKTRIDRESELLYTKLSAEIAMLQSDLRHLEAAVLAAGLDSYAQQIATQIDDLRAKGDAAYDLLQAWIATELDPAEAEIRRLEAITESAAPDARIKLMARIDELKATRAAGLANGHAENGCQYTPDTPS